MKFPQMFSQTDQPKGLNYITNPNKLNPASFHPPQIFFCGIRKWPNFQRFPQPFPGNVGFASHQQQGIFWQSSSKSTDLVGWNQNGNQKNDELWRCLSYIRSYWNQKFSESSIKINTQTNLHLSTSYIEIMSRFVFSIQQKSHSFKSAASSNFHSEISRTFLFVMGT